MNLTSVIKLALQAPNPPPTFLFHPSNPGPCSQNARSSPQSGARHGSHVQRVAGWVRRGKKRDRKTRKQKGRTDKSGSDTTRTARTTRSAYHYPCRIILPCMTCINNVAN
jgi:hypothetical protein